MYPFISWGQDWCGCFIFDGDDGFHDTYGFVGYYDGGIRMEMMEMRDDGGGSDGVGGGEGSDDVCEWSKFSFDYLSF